MMRIAKAATAYWSAIFALGFVLGTLRVLWIAPGIGESRAVLLELPVMLAASWLAARWLVRRFGIASAGQAAAMGALAFALLMASEALLALLLGTRLWEWLCAMTRIPGAIGLAGQVLFGVMPVVAGPARQ
jgi:hypothetical protein